MDSAHQISDPSDWLQTSLPAFSPLENALRCQVCKDFYDTPMITSCSHTFCSLCIRRCLSTEGKCPACRASEQASKLRRNWTLEEAVAAFQAARSRAIELATLRKESEDDEPSRRPGKRRRIEKDDEAGREESGSQRQTRSQSKRGNAPVATQKDTIEIEESGDEDYKEEGEVESEDGLVPCPMCGKRMKEESVFAHLDRCEDEQKKERQKPSRQAPSYPIQRPPSRPASTQPQERLAEINYTILNDTAFRKKLKELGIPNWGNKALMQRRHTEWVNLWNSNCDSVHPRSKRELLSDLDSWERSQGGSAREPTGFSNGVMKKDFDAQTWITSNKSDFSRLIEEAKRKAKSSPTPSPAPDTAPNPDTQKVQDSDTAMQNPPQETPYADDPEAIASIRAKVAATEAGLTTPAGDVENGFGHRAVPTLMHSLSAPSAPQEGTENEALLSMAHFGVDAIAAEKGSVGDGKDRLGDEERVERTQNGHGHVSPTRGVRKVPMFQVPEEPIQDVDER